MSTRPRSTFTFSACTTSPRRASSSNDSRGSWRAPSRTPRIRPPTWLRSPHDSRNVHHPRRRCAVVRIPARSGSVAHRPSRRRQRSRHRGNGSDRDPRRPHRRGLVPPDARRHRARGSHRQRHDRPLHRRATRVIGELLALVGASLVLLAAIGVVRLGDVLARLHALAKASSLGVLLLLAGASINLRDLNDLTSVVLAGILHLLASPPASNMVSRAAYLVEGLPAGAFDERRDRPTGISS